MSINKDKTINKETNSFYTKEEYIFLTGSINSDTSNEDKGLGFGWSNKSNRYEDGTDNCLYLYSKNGKKLDIEVTKNKGFTLEVLTPSFFKEYTSVTKRNLEFNDLQKELDKELNTTSLYFKLFKLNSFISLSIFFIFCYPLLISFYVIFNKPKESFLDIFKSKIKEASKFNYFILRDSTIVVGAVNLIIITSLITYLITHI